MMLEPHLDQSGYVVTNGRKRRVVQVQVQVQDPQTRRRLED